ncbi:MAG TPA: phenylacetic acid degradation operon negative regulatory protein PaaX [Herbaspirillum sp.]|jgi:phenylacetic acid degradation operon negative regulatory protein
MKKTNIKSWIAQLIKDQPLRAKSVVVTIFGDSIAPHGGSVWLGALIALMAPFGVTDRLVRTSVFRLAEEGWLDAQREGRRSAYTLTERGERRFERAYQRIYAPVESHWDGSWTLVFGLQGTVDAMERGALRKELLWEGFCMMSPGVFAHPSFRVDVLNEILARAGVSEQVFACKASELPGSTGRPLADLIEYGWDLQPVVDGYRQFVAQFLPLSDALEREDPVTPEQAFVIRTLLIHAFRRVQLHDPQLPVELLPSDWPGADAYELCRTLYLRTFEAAQQHLTGILESETGAASAAAPYFFERFGGLR